MLMIRKIEWSKSPSIIIFETKKKLYLFIRLSLRNTKEKKEEIC